MRRRTIVSRAALAGAAVGQLGPGIACHTPVLCDALSLRRRLPDAGTVGLTFDDGPHPQGTPRILSLLARHGATATFFLVGEQVRRDPSLAREIAAAGHTIGLHGDTHRCELRLTPAAIAEDRARGLDAISAATGVRPEVHRPPFGAPSGPGLILAGRARLRTILWSRWGRDWRAGATTDTVLGDVTRRGPLDRAIVLLHDADHYGATGSWRVTAGALPWILHACAIQGLTTVGVDSGWPQRHVR